MSNFSDRSQAGSEVAWKAPCRTASTTSLTLSAEQTVDGVALVDGDRVLAKDQSPSSANGIYIVRTGAWERAPDWDGSGDIVAGTMVKAFAGTVNANTIWEVTTTGTILVGTTSVTLVSRGLVIATPLAIGSGGTGSTTAATARTALGSTTVGDAVFIAATAAAARTAIGNGTIATQDANNVTISGGAVTGITDLAISDGGTAASTAANAFTNLKQDATTSATGVVELATQAEVNLGTDAVRAVCPSTLAGRPTFSADKGGVGAVTLTTVTEVQITFGTENWDIGSFFASSVWTPPAGKYRLNSSVNISTTNSVDNEQVTINVRKNGTAHRSVAYNRPGTGTAFNVSIDAIVDANGTDTFDISVTKSGAGNGTTGTSAVANFFQGTAL